MADQLSLFPSSPSRVPGAAQRGPARGQWEPFDFMDATANDPRMVPQPGAVIPKEIRLAELGEK